MITLENFKVEGFGSISNFEINLSQHQIVLLRGRTGDGKSTLFSALVWVLFGKNIKGVSEVNTWPRYRGKDYQGTMVSLYFKGDNTTYKIVRCQNYKGKVDGSVGKNRILFYKEAALVNTKGVKLIQQEIESAIGLSYNVFINSVLFGQGLKRLINETNSDKKDLFEEIFEVTYLSKAREITKKLLDKELTTQLDIKLKVDSIVNKLEAYQDNYKIAKLQNKEYQNNLLNKIAKLNDQINFTKKELEILMKDYNPNLLPKLTKKRADLQAKLLEVNKRLQTLKGEKVVSVEELVEEVITLLKNKKYKLCLKKLVNIKQLFNNIDSTQEERNELSEKLSTLSSKIFTEKNLSEKKILKESKLKTLKDDLFELKAKKQEKVDTTIKDKIKDLKLLLTPLQNKNKEQNKVIDNLKWVLNDPLSNHGLKAYLFESSLKELNDILATYSEVLEFHIQFVVDTSTKKKDFTTIIRFENQVVLYEELSGGQKQLVHLALAFAMNEIVTLNKGINIAFLDEIFENLSLDKIEVVLGLIKFVYKDKNLWLITHQTSLPISNAKVINTQRIKGLSNYTF